MTEKVNPAAAWPPLLASRRRLFALPPALVLGAVSAVPAKANDRAYTRPDNAGDPLFTSLVVSVASTTNTMISGVANQIIRIYGFDLILASSTTMTFLSGATALTGAMTVLGYSRQPIGEPLFQCTVGAAFNINLGSGVQLSGVIWYSQKPTS